MSLDKTAQKFLGTNAPMTHQGKSLDGDKAQDQHALKAAQLSLKEAAAFTEEIINFLNQRALALDLDPTQRIFAVALATINLRQNFPEDKGGKTYFDEVSRRAWEYYDSNK